MIDKSVPMDGYGTQTLEKKVCLRIPMDDLTDDFNYKMESD